MNNFIVDNLEIPFNNEWSHIAVSVSGGADSALLAYLLCKHISDNNLPIDVAFISHVRMWKTRPWQRYNSLDVYSYFLRTFKNIHLERYENFIAPDVEWGNIGPVFIDEYGKNSSGDIAQIRSYSEYICYYENVDAYYNGVSHNPRTIDLGGMEKRDVEPTEENQYLRLTTHMNKTVVHPFRFIEKDWIIRQYNRLQLTELLNNTRSCEGEFPDINYTTYTPGQYVPICKECFWCKERAWAIEQSK